VKALRRDGILARQELQHGQGCLELNPQVMLVCGVEETLASVVVNSVVVYFNPKVLAKRRLAGIK
jgi:hypothetical protein